MQSKKQIQQLLAGAGVGPNKRFGQNFLIDLNLMNVLVDSADIGSDDVVMEVGCGTGSLTEAIGERAGKDRRDEASSRRVAQGPSIGSRRRRSIATWS